LTAAAVLAALATPFLAPAQTTSAAAESVADDATFQVRYTATFSQDVLVFGKLMGYDTVHLPDGDWLNEPGKPMLPAQTVRIAVPAGMAVTNVRLLETTPVELAGEYSVFPAQPPLRMSDSTGANGFLEPHAQTYASPSAYPAKRVELTGQTDLAGQGIAILRIYPVHYVPARKKLVVHTSVSVALEGTAGYECGDYLPRTISRGARAAYQQTIEDMVVNPDHVTLQAAPREPPPSRALPLGGPYDHVIISRNNDVSYWQTLAEWHTKRGLKDIVVTTDYIYAEYGGADNQEKIRNFIIDAHSSWGTTYFLLCGENGDVSFEYRSYYEGDSIPSDQYYGDYDDDWTYEVYVGRSTARGSTEVNRFVNKVLKYEKDPPLTNYPLDATLLGMDVTTEDDPPLTRAEDLKELIDYAYIPGAFTVTKVYDTDSGHHRSAFISALNDGQNLVNHYDHSSATTMGTGERRHGWYIDNGDVDALSNTNRMSIVYSVGCHCNELDYYIDCIGEHFVIYNDLKAGVAFLGNTRNGWYYVGEPDSLSGRLDRFWWRAVFICDKWQLGTALAHTKQWCSPSDDMARYCHWTLNLLGEPEMSIWTEVPEALGVTHETTLPVESSSFNVHVEDGSGDVGNALVCLWKGDEVYLTGATNSSGYAYFTPAPATTGTMYVTVTKHNYLPYEGEAEVIEGATCDDGVQNQGEDLIDCGGPCPPCECLVDGMCDDGFFCTGTETCDAYGHCQGGSDPCTDPNFPYCDEENDECDECILDGHCDDGLYCNGQESCDDYGHCQDGTDVDCEDGVTCTDDSCNEGTDSCDNIPSDALCDDGLYCNGVETCDALLDCQAGGYPCGADQWCEEGGDTCINHGSGDFELDSDIDLQDFRAFQMCFGQPALGGCEPGNMAGADEMIDLLDFAEFEGVMTGP